MNGFTKVTPNDVLLNVLAVYSDVDNLILGHSFTVDTPSYTNDLNLTFTMNVTSEFTSDELNSLFTTLVYGGEWDRMEFDGLGICEDLTHDLLVSVMDFVDGIESMSVKVTGQSSEFTSTSVTANQVVKLGTLAFSQTVV